MPFCKIDLSMSPKLLCCLDGKKLRPLGWSKEDRAHSTVEPKSWQKALHLPGVGGSVVNLHLHAIVPLHTFPMAPSDKQLAIQCYQASIFMEHMEKLDLDREQCQHMSREKYQGKKTIFCFD